MKIIFFEVNDEEQGIISDMLSELDNTEIIFNKGVFDISLIDGAQIVSVFVNSEIRKDSIDKMPGLKLITTRSTGYDHIDHEYAKTKGIGVATVPSYGAHTVAEFTFALILTLSRKIYPAYNQLREGSNFDISGLRGFDLFGKTLGVIGMGKIGKNVIKMAKGFGMNVLANDINPDLIFAKETCTKCVSLEEVLAGSDIITIHTFLSDATRHLINKNNVYKIKKGAYLINTSRGEVVDTSALISAITDGHLAGAGLDVLEAERQMKEEVELLKDDKERIRDFKVLYENHVLIDLPQVIVTPHIAFCTKEAEEEILRITIDSIIGFAKGEVRNII